MMTRHFSTICKQLGVFYRLNPLTYVADVCLAKVLCRVVPNIATLCFDMQSTCHKNVPFDFVTAPVPLANSDSRVL